MTQVAHDHLERFYSLLARLSAVPGQGRPLCELSRRPSLLERGVYFFQEPGEYRAEKPNVLRIVRVGTHAVIAGAKSTLHSRLKAHLGTQTGSGNHRGSVFRRHVGAALLRRDGITLATWGVEASAPPAVRNSATARAAEAALEKRVSGYIGAMPVLWVCIPDEASYSARSFIERNAIALLSNQFSPIDIASRSWLGRSSPLPEIRDSALWNLKDVNAVYDPSFLDKFEPVVTLTCEKAHG